MAACRTIASAPTSLQVVRVTVQLEQLVQSAKQVGFTGQGSSALGRLCRGGRCRQRAHLLA